MATSFARVLGKGRFPQPARPSWDHLMTGQYDSRWVEIEGVVTAIEKQRLTLSISGGQIIVWVNQLDTNALRSLSGSLVRVRAFARRWSMRAINAWACAFFRLPVSWWRPSTRPAKTPSTRPSVPIAAVMGAGQEASLPAQFVKTVGVVTCRQPHCFSSRRVRRGSRLARRRHRRGRGDQVEAVGWPQPDGFSAKLGQAVVRRVGRGFLPRPQTIDLLTNNAGDLEQQSDSTRVS
jgi:hypothetical protein